MAKKPLAEIGVARCTSAPARCWNDTGHGCNRPVYGRLRARRDHARQKRDAVFGLFNLKNRGLLFHAIWSSSTTVPPVGTHPTGQSEVTSQRAAYDVVTLVAALVSAGAAVLALPQ